ncbi:MAG: hypothetical protein KIT31_24980 [Deltaproteobacteria bacterium]|nr:hypothetical protein [Deltaproteobacteria bacterium]
MRPPLPLVALLVTSAACSGASIGGPCDAKSGCGDGAVCDLTDPAGPTCIDADGDIDGDGIPNDKDFCNHMPGGAFDEDRDGLGDECDPCPIAPPLAEPDPDGDGVDAPCDPDPTRPGDGIALFEGFNGPIPATWRTSGAWQVVGGAAIATPDGNGVVELSAPLPRLTTQLAVLAAYRVDSADGTASQNIAGIATIDRRPAGTTRVQCLGRRTQGGQDALVMDSDRSGIVTKDFSDLFDPASLYQVAQVLDLGTGACAMIADNESGAVQAQTAGEAPNEAALVVRGAVVRFGYLLVVQHIPGGGT